MVELTGKGTIAVVVIVFILVTGAFLIGTIVGFNTAIHSFSGCEETPCEQLGVNASACEVCPERSGYKILRVR